MSDLRQTGILIADDEGEMRNLLALILKTCGYTNIEFASDGQKAIEMLGKPQIGLAFLDINMPGFSGIEVMTQVKDIRPNCYCVMVSGHSALENVLAALNAGARAFIVKPYNQKKIGDILAKFERESVQ